MENYTRIIGSTSTNIRTPTAGEINQGNVQLTPFDSAKNNGYSNEMSQQIGNISEELTTLITAAGLTPDATLGQVLEAITNLQNLGDAAGVADVYTSTFSTNSNTRYLIKINVTNTGASTLNGTAMEKFDGAGSLVALEAGDLVANQEYDILDNGSSIVVLNPPTTPSSASETVAGIAEIATQTEANTGTDDERFLTPLKLAAATSIVKQGSDTSASGTSVDFTGIPAGTKIITVILSNISTNGTSGVQIQLGDSGGIESSGYTGHVANGGSSVALSAGFRVTSGSVAASTVWSSTIHLVNRASNSWNATSISGLNLSASSSHVYWMSGSKTLSGELDRIRVTTAGGSNSFDAGSINIQYQ